MNLSLHSLPTQIKCTMYTYTYEGSSTVKSIIDFSVTWFDISGERVWDDGPGWESNECWCPDSTSGDKCGLDDWSGNGHDGVRRVSWCSDNRGDKGDPAANEGFSVLLQESSGEICSRQTLSEYTCTNAKWCLTHDTLY